ncbi:MAG TPA: TonB-dependent receptor, partial [Candidatus Acidoferrales bacterium]|nr:TonB-dependent receptor [Candidatus Acidoferrales bacterium]
MTFRKLAVFAFALGLTVAFAQPGGAGTTGGIHGRTTDISSGAPIVGAQVTAASPSQTETRTTDNTGYFTFISLAPDTYNLTATKTGYMLEQVPGITVISDQTRSVDIKMQSSLKTIARVSIHATGGLVRSGVVSDVYSISGTQQKAVASLGGGGAINQSYGAIASAPGVNYDQGQQGWYQNVYIRGGDIDQVAYEFDGVPVLRESDQGAVTTLTSLGQAELQVYTGGTPASADSPGLAGYINQVVKTGTYPGYANFTSGIGGPTLYNKATIEAGGATPDRLFSYYVGSQLVAQNYRYGDQFNGVSNPLYFYPISIGNQYPPPNGPLATIPTPLNTTVWDGSAPWLYGPGPANAIAGTTDQETIANFHLGIPHHHDSSKDDVQFLYDNSLIVQKFYGSVVDQGIGSIEQENGGPLSYFDGYAYNGQIFAPPQPGLISNVLFPNSPQDRAPFTQLPIDEREGSQNGVELEKFQYQHNISDRSFLRFDAYTDYAIWFISGPVSANLPYGGQLPDYEVNEHKYGGKLDYSNQLSDKNLIELTASYLTAHLETYSGQFGTFLDYAEPTSNLVDAHGNCYAYVTGQYADCFPELPPGSYPNPTSQGCIDPTLGCTGLIPGTPPAGSAAALNGARWLVTEPGPKAQIDTVKPFFSGFSANDQWRPNDKLMFNIGARLDVFDYRLDDLANGYPARAFWYAAYNREYCFVPDSSGPYLGLLNPATGVFACNQGGAHTDLVNFSGGTISQQLYQPRIGATYTVNSDLVLRATYGRYARPAATSYQEYNVIQQDSPQFISTFINMGYNSPIHYLHADTANNYDLSVEKRFHGTDMSLKLTPYYRTTQGQVEFLSLNAQGVLAGVNAGQQNSYGVELAFNKGSFAADGLALQASFTYLNSTIQYGPQPNGQNVIDLLNAYIKQYNSFTLAGNPALAGLPCFTPGTSGAPGTPAVCGGPNIPNPYFNMPAQPLMDPTARYTTYSQIPAPFNNANGFATPFESTLVLNYKHQKWAITPSFTFSDGESYGSPLVWPGYNPATCGNATAVVGTPTIPQTCEGYLFIPDKYTGQFDTLGAFRQPSRLTANVAISMHVSDRVDATLTGSSLIDHCWQRGFPWDSASTCIYGQLASNLLAPAGNF